MTTSFAQIALENKYRGTETEIKVLVELIEKALDWHNMTIDVTYTPSAHDPASITMISVSVQDFMRG